MISKEIHTFFPKGHSDNEKKLLYIYNAPHNVWAYGFFNISIVHIKGNRFIKVGISTHLVNP